MNQTAHIVGPVAYRSGDGPAVDIREGPVSVALTEIDATLSWEEEGAECAAALPIDVFDRYVQEGHIRLQKTPARNADAVRR